MDDGNHVLDRISRQALKRLIRLSVSHPLGHRGRDWIKGEKKNVAYHVAILNATLERLFLLPVMKKLVNSVLIFLQSGLGLPEEGGHLMGSLMWNLNIC